MLEKQEIQLNSFEKLYNKKLTLDEIEEMKHNFFGVMNLLVEIDREIKEQKND